jgi:hypothetical protein
VAPAFLLPRCYDLTVHHPRRPSPSRLFRCLAILSLAFAVATLALWGRSWWTRDNLRIGPEWSVIVHSECGRVTLMLTYFPIRRQPWAEWNARGAELPPATLRGLRAWLRYGLMYDEWDMSSDNRRPLMLRSWRVWIPHWFISLLALIVPCWWLWRRVRGRPRAWDCKACGYDLSGTAEGAACPECGAERVARRRVAP